MRASARKSDRIRRRRKLPSAPGLVLLAGLLAGLHPGMVLAGSGATAASDDREAHPCLASPDTARRLQCYERTLCALGPAAASREACLEEIVLSLLDTGRATVADTDPDRARDAASDSTAPPPIAPEAEVAEANEAAEADTSSAADSLPPTWARTTESAPPSGRHADAPESRKLLILAVQRLSGRRHRMLLDNDEVWQEYQTRRGRLEAGDRVEIRERTFGSFRMTGPDGLITGVRQVDCFDEVDRAGCRSLWQRAHP